MAKSFSSRCEFTDSPTCNENSVIVAENHLEIDDELVEHKQTHETKRPTKKKIFPREKLSRFYFPLKCAHRQWNQSTSNVYLRHRHNSRYSAHFFTLFAHTHSVRLMIFLIGYCLLLKNLHKNLTDVTFLFDQRHVFHSMLLLTVGIFFSFLSPFL